MRSQHSKKLQHPVITEKIGVFRPLPILYRLNCISLYVLTTYTEWLQAYLCGPFRGDYKPDYRRIQA